MSHNSLFLSFFCVFFPRNVILFHLQRTIITQAHDFPFIRKVNFFVKCFKQLFVTIIQQGYNPNHDFPTFLYLFMLLWSWVTSYHDGEALEWHRISFQVQGWIMGLMNPLCDPKVKWKALKKLWFFATIWDHWNYQYFSPWPSCSVVWIFISNIWTPKY